MYASRALTTILLLAVSKSCLGKRKQRKESNDASTCTLYIAESSMEGVNGVGIFTVKPFKEGDQILVADASNIPVVEQLQSDLLGHYWWGEGQDTSDDVSFESDNYVSDFGVTFYSLPNYHTQLHNTLTVVPEKSYDDSIVPSTDPGAGAFSYYLGRGAFATTDLEAGSELFLDYGLENRANNDHFPWFEFVPRSVEFEKGGEIMESNWNDLMYVRSRLTDKALEKEVMEHMLSAIKMTAKVGEGERLASVMPTTLDQLDAIAARTEGEMPALSDALAKEVSCRSRSVDWIVKNGRCIDNIVPGKSTLPHAGRGAFAQRFIAKGDVVVPMPLLHIVEGDKLTKFGEKDVSGELLLNYCFGHNESSLFLFPITNGIMINHCSDRTKECGENGPNAVVQWDTTFERTTKEWLNKSLEELEEETGRGLSLEVIATRDIQAGEEILFDYGEAWEAAWQEHMANWNPPATDPPSVSLLNEEGKPIDIVSGDLRTLADHPTITTGCVYWDEFDEDHMGYSEYRKLLAEHDDDEWYDEWEEHDDDEWYDDEWEGDEVKLPDAGVKWQLKDDGKKVYRPFLFDHDINEEELSVADKVWQDLTDEEILWYYGEDGSQFHSEDSPNQNFGGVHWPCSVVRQDGDDTYTVRVFPNEKIHAVPSWYDKNLPHFLTNLPRESIRYFARPGKSAAHNPAAFRHHIDLREGMFPEQWKDRKDDKKSEMI